MKNVFRNIINIFFLLFLVTGCQEEFTIEKWNKMDDYVYPKRKSILSDLLRNKLYDGMCMPEIVHTIGYPMRINGQGIKYRAIYYPLEEDFTGANEYSILFLELKLDADSCIISKSVNKLHWN